MTAQTRLDERGTSPPVGVAVAAALVVLLAAVVTMVVLGTGEASKAY